MLLKEAPVSDLLLDRPDPRALRGQVHPHVGELVSLLSHGVLYVRLGGEDIQLGGLHGRDHAVQVSESGVWWWCMSTGCGRGGCMVVRGTGSGGWRGVHLLRRETGIGSGRGVHVLRRGTGSGRWRGMHLLR